MLKNNNLTISYIWLQIMKCDGNLSLKKNFTRLLNIFAKPLSLYSIIDFREFQDSLSLIYLNIAFNNHIKLTFSSVEASIYLILIV